MTALLAAARLTRNIFSFLTVNIYNLVKNLKIYEMCVTYKIHKIMRVIIYEKNISDFKCKTNLEKMKIFVRKEGSTNRYHESHTLVIT